MDVQPTNLSLRENVLTIEWSDGLRLEYDADELRRRCPCALCNHERGQRPNHQLEPVDSSSPVTIQEMTPVGNYAYKIHFSDGHDTGIFTLRLLGDLGRKA